MPQPSQSSERTSAPGHIAFAAPRTRSLIQPAPAGTMQIVPGDRIATTKRETYSFEDVQRAFPKRYREKPDLSDIEKVLGEATLNEAVEKLAKLCIERDGGTQHLILNAAELKERAFQQEAVGIMNALLQCLAKGNQDEKQIKAAMRPQFSMRKLRRDPDATCSSLLRALKFDGFVYLSRNGLAFSLNDKNKLNPESYCSYYKRVICGE